jgi:CHAD domain-containing protein
MHDFPGKPLSPEAQERLERATDGRYRLKRDEAAAEGARRVAHGRVTAALEHLRRDAQRDLATAVHDTRKDMKKLRSLLRLVRDGLGDERYRAENARYRDAARLLAGTRDAEVKLATLGALREHCTGELPPLAGLTAALEAERSRFAGGGPELEQRLQEAAAAIDAGGATIDDWPLEGDGWKLLAGGIERSYRRGRRRHADVRADPSPEAVHEWRKRVKDLWYQLRLLRESWPEALEGPIGEAHRLADLLGDHHDLSVLADHARGAEWGDDGELATLLAAIGQRQDELLAAAIPLGERLYAEKPGAFAKRLGVYWGAARAD